MKTETVKVEWRGVIYWITMEQFEDLRSGYISWSDMFD